MNQKKKAAPNNALSLDATDTKSCAKRMRVACRLARTHASRARGRGYRTQDARDEWVGRISHATGAASHARDAHAARISRATAAASRARCSPALPLPFLFSFSSLPFPTCISPTTAIKHHHQQQKQPKQQQ